MIRHRFTYLELKEKELGILERLVSHCQGELKKKKGDKRINEDEVYFSIIHPVGVIGGLLTEEKSKNVISLSFIRRLIPELEGDMAVSYKSKSVRFYPHRGRVGLLKFPKDILIRIEELKEKGKLKIVEKRTTKGRVRYTYRKD